LGVVVLVVALIAIRHPNRNDTTPGSATRTVTIPTSSSQSPLSRPPSTSTSATQSSSAAGLVGALPLKVLNATSTPNLASQAADQFEAGGWTVTAVDENYSNNILSTAVYYDPSVANAQSVADALQHQFPAIKRVEPKFTPLVDGPVVVILTSDYSSG
jgi:LytR cell envelope-related transcriptional attenuator